MRTGFTADAAAPAHALRTGGASQCPPICRAGQSQTVVALLGFAIPEEAGEARVYALDGLEKFINPYGFGGDFFAADSVMMASQS